MDLSMYCTNVVIRKSLRVETDVCVYVCTCACSYTCVCYKKHHELNSELKHFYCEVDIFEVVNGVYSFPAKQYYFNSRCI